MFTGLYPTGHGVHDNGTDTLTEDRLTLAEILRANGYSTAAFVGSSILDRRLGANQGFDYYGDLAEIKRIDRQRPQYLSETWWERPASRVNEECVRVLSRCRRPFFAWCHYFDPHSPYAPPAPFDSLYRDRPYDGEIAAMDVQLGSLLEGVSSLAGERGLLIVALADHGECLGEHGYYGHAEVLYEEVLAIPVAFVWPGHLLEGRRFESLFRTTDVLPTLLELLKIDCPDGLDGVSRVSDFEAGKGGPEECFHETCSAHLRATSARRFAFRAGDLKAEWQESDSTPAYYSTPWNGGEARAEGLPERTKTELHSSLEGYTRRCLADERANQPRYLTDELEDAFRAIGYLR
jgi:arylsulfatase A-like enzyme